MPLPVATSGLVVTRYSRPAPPVASTRWRQAYSAVRPLRVTGYTFHALLLSIAFGAAAVLAVAHGFGGPSGDLAAPAWALVGLTATALACAVAIVATAALFVIDIREAGEGEA